jgi:hypothetical protein
MQDLFWIEAAKYQVLPLDDRFIERADPSLRPSLIAGRTDFTYFPGATRIPESSSPYVKNRSLASPLTSMSRRAAAMACWLLPVALSPVTPFM